MSTYFLSVSDELRSHKIAEDLKINFPSVFESTLRYSNKTYELLKDCVAQFSTIIQQLFEHISAITEAEKKARKHTNLLVSNFTKVNTNMKFIVNEGYPICAHSDIVSVWSEPFAVMLQSSMQEGLTKEIKLDADAQVVAEMVKYFYTASIDITANNIIPLLNLSLLYGIHDLRDHCLESAAKNMTLQNSIDIFVILERHNHEKGPLWQGLRLANNKFIRQEKNEILAANLDSLDFVLFRKLLDIILKYPDWSDSTPLTKEAILRYWKVSNFIDCSSCISRTIKEFADDTDNDKKISLEHFHIYCKSDILNDFEQLSKQKSFLKMPRIGFEILIQNKLLKVSREYVVLEAIHAWVQHDVAKRETELPRLIEHVRFPFISITELIAIPANFPIISKCPNFSDLCQEALQFQMQTVRGMQHKTVRKTPRKSYTPPPLDFDECVSALTPYFLKAPLPQSPNTPSTLVPASSSLPPSTDPSPSASTSSSSAAPSSTSSPTPSTTSPSTCSAPADTRKRKAEDEQ